MLFFLNGEFYIFNNKRYTFYTNQSNTIIQYKRLIKHHYINSKELVRLDVQLGSSPVSSLGVVTNSVVSS